MRVRSPLLTISSRVMTLVMLPKRLCVCVCVSQRLNTTPARPRHIRMRPLAVSPKDSSDTTKSPNQVCMSSAYESAVEDKDGIATADTSLEEGWDAAHEPGAGDER